MRDTEEEGKAMKLPLNKITLASLIIALQVGIAIAVVLEVYYFRHRRTVIAPGQFVLRMIVGAIFLALLSLIFGGVIGAFKFRSTESELWFWMCCLLLAVALLFLLLIDAHLLYKSRMRFRERLYEDLARDMLRSIVRRAAEQQNQCAENDGTQPDEEKHID